MEEVTLAQVLQNREDRAALQRRLVEQYQSAVLSFTLNIAGPVKNSPLIQRAFFEGIRLLEEALPKDSVLHRETKSEITGCEAAYAIAMEPEKLKEICVFMEESSHLGRLFDLDVIGADGAKLSRHGQRGCIVCGVPGWTCSSRRIHSVPVLQAKTTQIITEYFALADRKWISRLAADCLIEEVFTTPKPGLVDCRNNGSHEDMTVSTFLVSAGVLEPYFERCVQIGQESAGFPPEVTFSYLREAGISAERDMFRATQGVNTHKGIIYSLGTICGALGRLWKAEKAPISTKQLFSLCSTLASPAAAADFARKSSKTAGERWFLEKGVTGIRGEVSGGFPSLTEIALPRFSFAKNHGLSREESGIYALLHLIARMDDTNLLHRGGVEGAAWAKAAAKKALDSTPFPSKEEIERLDDAFIARNLSPGGAADLLALVFFLTSLENAGFLLIS